jgi:hypothetical protein
MSMQAPSVPEGTYAVPDDEDYTDLLLRVGEYLIDPVCGPPEPNEDGDTWNLPEAVTRTDLSETWSRIYQTITETLAATRPRLLAGPSGYGHLPVVLVVLDEADLAPIRELDAVLQAAVNRQPGTAAGRELMDLSEVLDQTAKSFERELAQRPREKADEKTLAGMLHRALGVLELSGDEPSRPLMVRLALAGA